MLRDFGRIINISSGVTRIAFPHLMACNLTKGAVNTFTLHLAALLGPRQITVNAVMPGIVDTDATPRGSIRRKGRSSLPACPRSAGQGSRPTSRISSPSSRRRTDDGSPGNASTRRAARICNPKI